MGKRGTSRLSGNDLEAAYEQHLKDNNKAATTITQSLWAAHRFMRYVGPVPLNQITEDTARAFFDGFKNRATRRSFSAHIHPFLQFAAAWANVPVTGKGAAVPLTPAVIDEKR